MYNILFAVNSRMAFVWYYRYIKTKKKNAFLFLLKTTAVTLTNRKKRKKKKIVGRTDYYTDTITGRKIPEKKKNSRNTECIIIARTRRPRYVRFQKWRACTRRTSGHFRRTRPRSVGPPAVFPYLGVRYSPGYPPNIFIVQTLS